MAEDTLGSLSAATLEHIADKLDAALNGLDSYCDYLWDLDLGYEGISKRITEDVRDMQDLVEAIRDEANIVKNLE